MKFLKKSNSMFGVSGYIQYVYEDEENDKKRLIITFSNPWRDSRPKMASVALLHESDLSVKDLTNFEGADLYVKLKNKKGQAKMKAYDTSCVKKVHKDAYVSDDKIKVKCFTVSEDKDHPQKMIVTVEVEDAKKN